MRSGSRIEDGGRRADMTTRGCGPSIRPAEPGDATAIADLSAQLDYPTRASLLAVRLEALDPEENLVLVVEDAGRVVGWIHVFRSHRLEENVFAELGGLILSRDYRGEGLGRRLMEYGEQWAREHGCAKFRVRSHEKRAEAHRFYERVGYRTVKRQQVFDKDLGGEDR
jgi:GNAT superfamily N-acetyltransferase